MNAVITGTGMNLPERVLTNADVEAYCDTSDEWIRKRTGIGARHRAEPGTGTSDLALPAAEAALAAAGLDAAELDAILFCTVTPDKFFPASGNLLQGKLGAVKAASFDINAACTGFVCGMATANGFIQSGLYRKVLVVGAEITSPLMYWERRDTAVLFGDGAGAVVVEAVEEDRGVLSMVMGTDGTKEAVLHVPGAGSIAPITPETADKHPYAIHMDGQELFKEAVYRFVQTSEEALEKAGIGVEDIALFVPHQANARIIRAAGERLGIGEEKTVMNLDRVGNTVAASIPMALHEAVQAGRVQRGDYVLVSAFGAGLTWGAFVLRW